MVLARILLRAVCTVVADRMPFVRAFLILLMLARLVLLNLLMWLVNLRATLHVLEGTLFLTSPLTIRTLGCRFYVVA